jgi:hypothetical protein
MGGRGNFIDLTGRRFGDKVVTKKTDKKENKGNYAYWECLCDRGHLTISRGTSLIRGESNTCKKCIKDNEIGNTYGSWEVIDFGYYKKGRIYWKCKCSCGRTIGNVLGVSLRGHKSTCCELCRFDKPKLDEGESGLNELFAQYKRSASTRNIFFKIDKDFFRKITKEDCYYCGVAPYQFRNRKDRNGPYVYNGIDRKNNNEGYIISNCVPCCGICNHAKLKMSENEFYNWIDKVYNRLHYQNIPSISFNLKIKLDSDIKLIKKLFNLYRRSANYRNKSFKLSLEVFTQIIFNSCFYCGEDGENHKCDSLNDLCCNGVDRRDNNLGYDEENCVSCCKSCNIAKCDMPEQEFYSWIDRVYHHIHRNDNITISNPEESNIQVSLPVYEVSEIQYQLV